MTEKEIFERLRQTVEERWTPDAGIGTLEGECCVLGCVSLVEDLPLWTGHNAGGYYYLAPVTNRLAYPDQNDPIVIALDATIPDDFQHEYNEHVQDDGAWNELIDKDLRHDRITTYNDFDGRTKAEILAWVQRAKEYYDANNKETS